MATRDQDTLKRILACRTRRENIKKDNVQHSRVKFELVHAENKLAVLKGKLIKEENLLRIVLQVARDVANGALPFNRGGKAPAFIGSAISAENSVARHRSEVARLNTEIRSQQSKVVRLRARLRGLEQSISQNNGAMDRLRCGDFPLT